MGDKIKGLILSGGISERMGVDKGSLMYHGIPQREYLANMMSQVIGEVYLSCHPARMPVSSFPVIEDTFLGIGPMGGLLSAFHKDEKFAWFTVPCDMPLVDIDVIRELLQARDTGKKATCFVDPDSGRPEPLIAIWELSMFPVLMESYGAGQYSLRKVLMKENCKMVESLCPGKLRNVNTREEYDKVVSFISGKHEGI